LKRLGAADPKDQILIRKRRNRNIGVRQGPAQLRSEFARELRANALTHFFQRPADRAEQESHQIDQQIDWRERAADGGSATMTRPPACARDPRALQSGGVRHGRKAGAEINPAGLIPIYPRRGSAVATPCCLRPIPLSLPQRRPQR
jgi:hypothetical protein